MWKEYLYKANMYKILADFYKYRNYTSYKTYRRKYDKYLEKLVEAYEKDQTLKENRGQE
ncbi:hypothetical protein ACFO25_14755 [Paenactinomyces guangxiensis]|uniref:Uncharacterized protein n=1 Tax=Paenactinomyces guangxiensis TaxID=1490290 RepID=A0A7W1WPV7_9BACL|nr:hypothetical protein [Paenactinomyces guangxiensis]MBA4493881.1 hypothetical protein [Paenactinomyces guangxiensis]MBH8591347.1 hypothetical protein [Paenactinomyces guangxiensis]